MAAVTVLSALLLIGVSPVLSQIEGLCPDLAPPRNCPPDMCNVDCPAFPTATCIIQVCGSCSIEHYIDQGGVRQMVNCELNPPTTASPPETEAVTTGNNEPVDTVPATKSVFPLPIGPQCPDGCRGDKGSKGEPGWYGPRGMRGLPGSAGRHGKYIIYTDGYILPSGSRLTTAQAKQQAGGKVTTATEFSPEARGDKGERGPAGPGGVPGVPGTPGPMGRQGVPGPIGLKGAIGELGPKGIDGQRGWTGEPGPRGDRGITGPVGDSGTTGPPGPNGLPGVRGAKGLPGLDGQPGQSGPAGVPGQQGIPGVTGAPGLGGDRGVKGQTGLVGETGDPGVTGAQGVVGAQGQVGLPGIDGVDGDAGARGPQGKVGAYGPDVKEVPLLSAAPCSSTNNGKVQYDFVSEKLYFCNGREWRCVDHVDCGFSCRVSDWEPWTPCSQTCGGGTQSRHRTVVAAPGPYGNACPALRNERTCENAPCTCNRPGGVANGRLSSNQATYAVGESAAYTCNVGFDFDRTAGALCMAGGQFSARPQCRPVQCPDPGSVENGQRSDSTLARFYNGRVTYACDDGYAATGARVLTCTATGRWSSAPPRCLPVSCPDPGTPANGGRDLTSLEYTSRVSFFCHDGYLLQGAMDLTCLATGQWSSPTPVCAPVSCSHPGTPEYGSFVASDPGFTYSSTVTFSCNDGYALIGSPMRICQADGSWSGDQPVCNSRSCPQVSAPENGEITTFTVKYEIGSRISFDCQEGYELQGERSILCQTSGAWTAPVPVCERLQCCSLSEPSNGRLIMTGRSYSAQAFYTCDAGYRLEGSAVRTCQVSGAVADWSGRAARCVAIMCADPGAPTNSVRQPAFALFQAGDSVDYSCTEGFSMSGIPTLNCLETGKWDNPLPECQEILCSDPGTPENGARSGDSLRAFSTLEFTCNENFKLVGSASRTCQVDMSYTGVQPTCEPDCVVGNFGAWSQCSVTCGSGDEVRTRQITQAPSPLGEPCPNLLERRPCTIRPCVQCYGRYGANESAYIQPSESAFAADVLVVVELTNRLDSTIKELPEFLMTLELELLKTGTGADPNLPNRYTVVGYGTEGSAQCGHFLLPDSAEEGQTSFFLTEAVTALEQAQVGPAADVQDGYQAMKFIIDNAELRFMPNVAKNLIFLSDSPQIAGCSNPAVTKEELRNAMLRNGITPNFILDQQILIGNDKPEEVLGIRSLLPGPEGNRLAYIRERNSRYRSQLIDDTVTVDYSLLQGSVQQDYTDLSFSLGGMMWNLNVFRFQVPDSVVRASFLNAFKDVKSQEIVTSATACKYCTCEDDGAQGRFRCQLQYDETYCGCRASGGTDEVCRQPV